jgi:hypothetical protein
MEMVLRGIKNVLVYIDDLTLMIYTGTHEEHFIVLEQVFEKNDQVVKVEKRVGGARVFVLLIISALPNETGLPNE